MWLNVSIQSHQAKTVLDRRISFWQAQHHLELCHTVPESKENRFRSCWWFIYPMSLYPNKLSSTKYNHTCIDDTQELLNRYKLSHWVLWLGIINHVLQYAMMKKTDHTSQFHPPLNWVSWVSDSYNPQNQTTYFFLFKGYRP